MTSGTIKSQDANPSELEGKSLPPPTQSQSANNLNNIRVSLAIMVIFSHAWPYLDGTLDNEPFNRILHHTLTGGVLAVNAFFAISGYLITQSWERSTGWQNYLKKRVLRIVPGFAVAWAFTLFLVPLISLHFQMPSYPWRQVIKQLIQFNVPFAGGHPAIPGVFADNPIKDLNGALWTIRYEFWCYLLLGGIGLLGILRKRYLVLALFLATWLTHIGVESLRIHISSQERFLIGNLEVWPRFATYFLAGAVFYLFRDRIRLTGIGALASLLLIAASCFGKQWAVYILPITGVYILFYLGFSERMRVPDISKRIGDLSYGIYLYAAPIEQLLVQYLRPYLTHWSLGLLTTAIAAGIAWCSWRWVEHPFLRMKGNSTQPSFDATTAVAKA